MLENGRGLIKALENWAKKVTTDYKDVNVRDLSTSFRDGLAFCAIIHYYRPDLIDFDSLSRENIFENNSLAFSVAEKQLGVPALLDAEDMVKCAHPDRLSIITYLSQLRNCFENQNKVNKKPELKRIQSNSIGPPAKVSVVGSSLKRHEVCQICKHRVFILERLIVDRKLYHTACFRCHKCNNLLNPGAYVESDTPGVYECSVCLTDETSESTESSVDSSIPEQPNDSEVNHAQSQVSEPVVVPKRRFASREAVSFAKSNLSESNSCSEKSSLLLHPFQTADTHSKEMKEDEKPASGLRVSVKDKINVFEKNQVNEKPSLPISSPPVPKVRLSLNGIKSPNVSDQFSTQQSSNFAESSPKCEKEFEIESSPTENVFAKSLAPEKEFSVDKRSSDGKILKDFTVEDANNSSANSNSSLHKVPNVDSGTSSSDKESHTVFVRSGLESPKVTRDIFKSSLQPLKLSLLPSVRKEKFGSPKTPEKNFDIPEIKSSYLISNVGKTKHSTSIKENNSECNLNSSIDLQKQDKTIRRSSLESNCEAGSKESQKSLLRTNSNTFHRTNSSHELGCHPDTNVNKSGLKDYTPIYKSLYSTSSSNIASIRVSKISQNSTSIQPKISPEVKQEDFSQSPKSSDDLELPSETTGETASTEVRKGLEVPSVVILDHENDEVKGEEYPDDLNPFGDEESKETEDYPDDLNPFGEEEEETNTSKISAVDYDESKNPFASDEDEEKDTSTYSPKSSNLESTSSYFQDSICSNVSSPSGSLKGTLKKRPAPKPPKVTDIFPRDSAESGTDLSLNSIKLSPSVTKKSFQTSSPKVRKNKPAPPPPPSPRSVPDQAASVKMTKETDNMKLKSTMSDDKQPPKQFKKKKRPAPPVPIPVRRDMKKIPLREIIQEMKEIEEKQREYETQGREIELLIRDRDKDEEPSVEEEECIMQLFELVNQKNALFRRQAELMYIKRSQRLEEQQYQIEQEIRQLMEKPDSEKTDEDKEKEENLTLELIDIVDQRNSIIDSIEMDRRRELEEDHSVQEQLEIKNGDLPITAEIKQKSGKNKKSKEKKKEKKKQSEEESGKGTLKKKKNLLFKRS